MHLQKSNLISSIIDQLYGIRKIHASEFRLLFYTRRMETIELSDERIISSLIKFIYFLGNWQS